MRLRSIGVRAGAAIVPIALVLGWVLSLATTRVANWFVMTDELYYERLAISVAQTGSILPRLHGEVVSNVNQLYPVLLSSVFGDGDVPASLEAAHRLNAFVMATAAIPVYLLARRIGIGWLASLWIGALAVAVPWIVLSSFLLTEVVAYPAFCWALLGLTVATIRRTALADVMALASIALAVLARTHFFVLLPVLAVAVAADAVFETAGGLRPAGATLWQTRKPLLGAYLALGLAAVVLAIGGDVSRALGSYAGTTDALQIDFDVLRLAAQQVAVLALGLAVLPFLLGTAWLIERLRASAPVPERAFAAVGSATVVLLVLQVAAFNRHFGAGQVKDRYLFYAVPVVLVALAAAVSSPRWPKWWALLVPTAVCVAGFSSLPLPTYQKLNVDSPLAMLNDKILELAGSLGWARVLLVLATLVGAQLLLMARLFLPTRAVAIGLAALATFALPGQAVYAFDRLFAVNGTNGLPVTLDQGVVFDWIDRAVGGGGDVTMLRYPANRGDYWAGVQYWWDVEFWNESVVEDGSIGVGLPGPEPWTRAFDERTGAARRLAETVHVLVHQTDVRFRLAGKALVFDRDAYLIEPERPWRASFVTRGIYPDGWTRPHRPATIRVFADPGQRTAVKRFLTMALTAPEAARLDLPVTISSNLEQRRGRIAPGRSLEPQVTVCVPAGGYGEIEVDTPIVTDVYRDPTKAPLTGETDRPAGLLVRWLALADEEEPVDACP
jgi:hypothetical protein